MDSSDIITLVALPTLRSGAIEETETPVFCRIHSVGYRETYAAAAVGVKPEMVVALAEAADYAGQPFARHAGKLYKVYRVYRGSYSNARPHMGTGVELTLTAPVGLKDTIETCYLGADRVPAWCAVGYVQLEETDEAGLSGLLSNLHLLVGASAYHGEDLVEYSGKSYAVRRTFQEDRDLVDLYVEERAGI